MSFEEWGNPKNENYEKNEGTDGEPIENDNERNFVAGPNDGSEIGIDEPDGEKSNLDYLRGVASAEMGLSRPLDISEHLAKNTERVFSVHGDIPHLSNMGTNEVGYDVTSDSTNKISAGFEYSDTNRSGNESEISAIGDSSTRPSGVIKKTRPNGN
jgi:hypothetical protein